MFKSVGRSVLGFWSAHSAFQAFVPAEERVNQEKNYHKMSLAELQKMMPSVCQIYANE